MWWERTYKLFVGRKLLENILLCLDFLSFLVFAVGIVIDLGYVKSWVCCIADCLMYVGCNFVLCVQIGKIPPCFKSQHLKTLELYTAQLLLEIVLLEQNTLNNISCLYRQKYGAFFS